MCLDSAEDYPIDPRAFSGLISNGQDHLLRWLHQRFSWNPVFTWACNMRHDHLNSEDYEDDDRHQPDQPFSDISPETRESHIASCRALFHAIKDIGAPVQLLLPGHRGNGMLFDPVHGYGDFRPSCRIWPTADISEWYLNSIGDLVDDLRILEGDDAPDFTDHLVDFERRSTMKQFREWEREELEFEKECSSKLWRELANIFPNLTRLQVHVLADIYPAKDDDDFIATVLPGKGWMLKRRKDEFNKSNGRTYLSRTFVRAVDDGEPRDLDSVVASTAALEI